MELNKVYLGNSLEVIKTFPDESIDCVVTSPPYYGLRDYGTGHWEGGDPNCKHYRTSKASEKTITGHKRMQEAESPVGDAIYKQVCPICGAVRVDEQIGLEETPEEYINRLVTLFREIRRVLKKEGTCWVNLGDTYNGAKQGNTETVKHKKVADNSEFSKKMWNGAKQKDLIGIPWMFAFAMRNDGWYLRQDIIWAKGNPMPESVTDRCTKSHEYIFLFSKSDKYYFDYEAIMEPCSDQDRTNFVSGSRKFGKNEDGNDNDLSERSKNWKPKTIRFGGKKYGDNDDPHFATYSGNPYIPKFRSQEQGYAQAGGHRDNSGGFAGDVMVRNKRDVWNVNVKPNKEAHFATYPQELIIPCILAGCPTGGGQF